MSQAGIINVAGGGTTVTETLTGNSGGAVPPTGNNINILGAGNITVSGNPGTSTLTISQSFSELAWTDKNSNFTAASNNGYFVTATAIALLPSAALQGDICSFVFTSASGSLTIQAAIGQLIQVGTAISVTNGTTVANQAGSSITFVFRAANSTWYAITAPEGNWVTT